MASADTATFEVISAASTGESSAQRAPSALQVLVLSAIFLALAHLAVKELFPQPAVWLVGAMLILATGIRARLVWKDDFALLLVLFVCAHFNFADNQGGLWSYVFCAVFLGGRLLGCRGNLRFFSVPWHASALLLVFLLHQLSGLALNHYSAVSNLQAAVVTVSQVLAFYCCASQWFDEATLRRFFRVWFAVVLWVFVAALNQKYHWIITASPLLPQRYYGLAGKIASVPAASFGNSELFGEYFCFVFILAVVFISHVKEVSPLRLNRVATLFVLLAAVAAIMMSASRAAFLLAVASAAFLSVSTFLMAPSARSFRHTCVTGSVIVLSAAFIWGAGNLFSLDAMMSDLADLKPAEIDVISGKGMNRSFTVAYRLLAEDSWVIGKGYNLPENNTASLGLPKGASDYHSLYVCIPFFYGWGGSAALVLLIVGAAVRIFFAYLGNRRRLHVLVPVALAFTVIWGAFLLDQYKISVTRNPSYFLMTWMLLGWTHALANSLRTLRCDVREAEVIGHDDAGTGSTAKHRTNRSRAEASVCAF